MVGMPSSSLLLPCLTEAAASYCISVKKYSDMYVSAGWMVGEEERDRDPDNNVY